MKIRNEMNINIQFGINPSPPTAAAAAAFVCSGASIRSLNGETTDVNGRSCGWEVQELFYRRLA